LRTSRWKRSGPTSGNIGVWPGPLNDEARRPGIWGFAVPQKELVVARLRSKILVRDLRCPGDLDPWKWVQVLDRIGDLLLAHVVGSREIRSTMPDGTTRVVVDYVLSYDDEAWGRMIDTVAEVLGTEEPWRDPDPDAWKQGDGDGEGWKCLPD